MKVLSPTDLSGATAFSTTLEGNLKAKVRPASWGKMSIWDSLSLSSIHGGHSSTLLVSADTNPDKEVLSVSVEKDPSFGYETVDEKQLAGLLIDLYKLARRSALKIDGSVEKALSYLDRIAVNNYR